MGEAQGAERDIEQLVRTRLRSLRTSLGLSLDELAGRAGMSPSTLSRIETGKRTIGLDVLVPLARSLQVDLESLLDADDDSDVVIRPTPASADGRTTWVLSRPDATTQAVKMRFEPGHPTPEPRVHPGHDWFFVLEGTIRLLLGDREVLVHAGEAAEFGTMTPHAMVAVDEPAEVVVLFDRHGQQAHVHR